MFYFVSLSLKIQIAMVITIYKPKASSVRIRNKKQCSANDFAPICGYECHKQKLPVVKQRLPSGNYASGCT